MLFRLVILCIQIFVYKQLTYMFLYTFFSRLLFFVFGVLQILQTLMECDSTLSHECIEQFWLLQLQSRGSTIRTVEHVIFDNFKQKNMATVYQCVKCKDLFRDINAVSMHACQSLTQPKDLQKSKVGEEGDKNQESDPTHSQRQNTDLSSPCKFFLSK